MVLILYFTSSHYFIKPILFLPILFFASMLSSNILIKLLLHLFALNAYSFLSRWAPLFSAVWVTQTAIIRYMGYFACCSRLILSKDPLKAFCLGSPRKQLRFRIVLGKKQRIISGYYSAPSKVNLYHSILEASYA